MPDDVVLRLVSLFGISVCVWPLILFFFFFYSGGQDFRCLVFGFRDEEMVRGGLEGV